ncbi:MurR/RpiR family transcriptional regulator [Microbacterium sp. NPDC089695]|uniref:MurR/RpiR family transcriptional regulator n=1 Tax=Microbacterium sp. NPDC089695 TaxID=3364198 RepID=UPI003827DEAB
MSIQTTIASAAETLPPSLGRIARVVADEPRVVIDSTITELAAQCDTSVASVIRFCRAIGVNGYAALRMTLAAELGRESAQFHASTGFGSEISPDDTLREASAKVAALELLAIEETIGGIDDETLDTVVAALDAAPRILLFGIGASGLVAADLAQKLLRIGRTAVVLGDAHVASAVASLGGTGMVALGISQSGTTVETLRFIEAARDAGSTTIAITGASDSALADAADHALLTRAREPRLRAGAMVSRIAQLALVDCLFVGVARRRHADAVDALERTAAAARTLRVD